MEIKNDIWLSLRCITAHYREIDVIICLHGEASKKHS